MVQDTGFEIYLDISLIDLSIIYSEKKPQGACLKMIRCRQNNQCCVAL